MLRPLQIFILSCVSTTAAATFDSSSLTAIPTRLIHQCEPITWVENLAVRPNGQLLPVTTTSSVLNQIDPDTGSLTFVHDFSSAGNAIQGITEVQPDYFALNVLTCNITGDLTCTSGSLSTWSVDFRSVRHHEAVPRNRKIAAFPDAGFLNGVATLDGRRGLVLMADSFKGGIWRLNTFTGEKALVFTDPSMAGTAEAQNGINGIRVRPGELFFINSALGTFNRIPIDPTTGAKRGNATVIASGLAAPDDFEIDDGEGVAYLCNGFLNQVLTIELASGNSEILVELPGPTSVRWGSVRREKRLFASTIGGLLQYVEHNVTIGGAVYEIER